MNGCIPGIIVAVWAAEMSLPLSLNMVLKRWETAARRARIIDARFNRFEYDSVFNVERRSCGRFYFEGADRMSVSSFPHPETAGRETRSRRRGKDGRHFKLEYATDPETLLFRRGETLCISPRQKRCEQFLLERDGRGRTHPRYFCPPFVEVDAATLKSRYRIELTKCDGDVWLRLKPIAREYRANFTCCDVILDRATWLPRAVRLVDPTGNGETVYVLFDMQINRPPRDRDSLLSPDLMSFRVERIGANKK